MTAYWWPIGAILLLAAPAAADPPAPAAQTADDFDSYRMRGDAARVAGRFAEAAEAYAQALALRDDPTVAGHAGLMLFELQAFDAAAYQLLQAIEEPSAGSSDAERAQFFRTYQAARREVCRVDIVLNQKGARVEIDGEVRQEGPADFWSFVVPGKRTVRAQLEGFDDAIEEFTATPGGRVALSLSLLPTPLKTPAPPVRQAQPKVAPGPLYGDKPPPNLSKSGPKGRFVLGGGATIVFGATPNVAVGPQIFTAWRSRSWWEVGLDLRAAWALASIARVPDARIMTWSTTLTPCARWRDRWFACALAQIDGFVPGSVPSASTYLFGGGLRVGAEFHPDKRLALQVWGETVAHTRGFRSWYLDGNAWDGSRFFGALGIRALLFF